MLRRVSDLLERASERVARSLLWFCLGSILAMMVLTLLDVCGRYFLNKPIRGAFELTEFLLVFVVACGLAYTQVSRRHISVEFMVSRVQLKARRMIQGIGYLICLSIYVLITWQGISGGLNQWHHRIISGAFSIPLWPFYLFLAFGCSILCLVFLTDLLKLMNSKGDRER